MEKSCGYKKYLYRDILEFTMVIAIILSSVQMMAAQKASTRPPKLVVKPGKTFEIGDLYSGQKTVKSLTIANRGGRTLTISDIATSCGCTSTKLSDSVLAPGKEGELRITFNSENLPVGKVTKHITITSNDKAAPKTDIEFSANILPLLDIDPQYISLSNGRVDTTYARTVHVTNRTKKPIEIVSIKSTMPEMQANMKEKHLAPDQGTDIQAMIHASQPGTLHGSIELETDSATAAKVIIWVFGNIKKK